MRSRFFRRFTAGVLVIPVAAWGSLLLGGVANAAGPTGTLTFNPTTGSDQDIVTATTSGGCPGDSTSVLMDVVGPIGKDNQPFPSSNPYVIHTPDTIGFSHTESIDVPENNSLLQAVVDRGQQQVTPGEYQFTVHCANDINQEFGTFTGSRFFTDSTHYNAGASSSPSPSPSPSPSSSPSPSPSPSPSESATPTPSATPDSATTTPATSTSDGAGATTSSDPGGGTQPLASTGTLAKTGAPIALGFLGGLILLAAGLALVVWLKRPRKAALSDGGDTASEQETGPPDRQ